MAKILIIEDDPVFAAVLEDRLHVAGHVVESTAEPTRGIELAVTGGVDLVLLKMGLPSVPGLEVLQTLRHRGETRSIPIIALAPETDGRERVATLRAGADELLTQPVDLEELLIRVGRLLGSREASPALMQGDLGNHPPWELMQFVQQSGQSGELIIRSPRGIGQVHVSAGRVMSARFQKLQGRDALLALLELRSGHFRLTTDDTPDASDAALEGIPIPEVLMASAWLEDELKKRQEHLPATGVPLELVADTLPALEAEMAEIPIAAVFERLGRQAGRLFDLIAEIEAAPSKVRLAVAWLVEQKVVAPSKPGEQFMTTTEISSTVVLDMALRNLLTAATEAGFEANSLPYLLLVEPGVWPHLRQLLESVPGYARMSKLPKLVEQVKLRQGGSATFETESGSLSLHVQILSPDIKAQVEGILSLCAGVLLWLDEAKDRELISGLIDRLETTRSATAGVLVAQEPEKREMILGLLAGKKRWQSSSHAPQSLIGVFRLLHPRV